MSKRPAGEQKEGAGGKRIHFADESIHGPEHLSLVRRMEDMEREIRSLRSQIAEKDALLEQFQERIHELNEENRDLHKRIKERAINTKDFGVQAELPPFEAARQVAPDADPQAVPDAASDAAADVAPPAVPDVAPPAVPDAAPLSPPEVPQAPQRRVATLRMSKRPAGKPDEGAGGKRIHFADESIHGPEHLRLIRRMEEMERENRSLRGEIAEKDALLEQYEEKIRDLNDENKDLHRRIKEKAVNTKDFGVQAELPPLEAVPLVAPEAAPDAAPLAAPDAPLSPHQAASDDGPLSPPPLVPPQARQRRAATVRRARADPPYKLFKHKKRKNNPVPLDDIANHLDNTSG
ncbi:hypothetical protein HNY73_014224 [Argiope bruennichi]|uniref:Uncharacterized protein n=1 Tax=Argiope bruennichi TaxID=94029 RepID=A0A8T0ESL8_ARGBR|nr:hypothetical protein HNY73_014224 [Argiope bruennichi]